MYEILKQKNMKFDELINLFKSKKKNKNSEAENNILHSLEQINEFVKTHKANGSKKKKHKSGK